MKKITTILMLGVILLSAYTLTTEWKVVNKNDVKVEFQLETNGTKGRFKSVETTVIFDKADLKKSSIKGVVDVKSISTDNEGRDAHLLNADFFDVEKFPTIIFESTELNSTSNGFIAMGNLTMKGQTHPVEVPFEFEEGSDGTASFKGSMSVSPYQFGVVGKKGETEKVKVTIAVPLKK